MLYKSVNVQFYAPNIKRRQILIGIIASLVTPTFISACSGQDNQNHPSDDSATLPHPSAKLNMAKTYPTPLFKQPLHCQINLNLIEHAIDSRIFGTNLEWFNNAGGLVNQGQNEINQLTTLAINQGVTVYRFPGGTLADFYHWREGTGRLGARPMRKHPTDPGISSNDFGSPEFFNFLQKTNAQGLITVNAGTGSAEEAAAWVAYANTPQHAQRIADGIQEPVNIKLWEIGNELYLPGNPGEQIITTKPEVYAARYLKFAQAMRAVDPSITLIAIGVAKSHIGPDTAFPEWTEVLLQQAAAQIDMVAIHNAYFPMLYHAKNATIAQVYTALWAAPETVKRSLNTLSQLLEKYEGNKKIDIAVTEWGALFSLPFYDPYWTDHVKTLGSGVYLARLMQVFIGHPRVKLTNYFKLVDRSFMGWINYANQPKVPYYVFQLFAQYTGDQYLSSRLDSPVFDSQAVGIMMEEKNISEVTVMATRSSKNNEIYINFVNRSMVNSHQITLDFIGELPNQQGELHLLSGNEPTAHNGRDIPPEWPYRPEYEPYSSAGNNTEVVKTKISPWTLGNTVTLPAFSIATLMIKP